MKSKYKKIREQAKEYIEFLKSRGLTWEDQNPDSDDYQLYEWRYKFGNVNFWACDLAIGIEPNITFKPVVYKCKWKKEKNGKMCFYDVQDEYDYAEYKVKDFESFKKYVDKVIKTIKTGYFKNKELEIQQDFV